VAHSGPDGRAALEPVKRPWRWGEDALVESEYAVIEIRDNWPQTIGGPAGT